MQGEAIDKALKAALDHARAIVRHLDGLRAALAELDRVGLTSTVEDSGKSR